MSYLAIARKWRPLTFDQVAGQKHVTRTLRNAIRMDRIHHAYLFTGPRGVGKTTVARILARALNCAEGPTEQPCGKCDICKAILAGSAPDVMEIDGASNNSVDDVRELREGVRYLPGQGRYRIYIIDEVHMLTREAFNALLKTLEEPPPHVVFVFATTEVRKIPETILSRVQRFDFRRIPGNVVVQRLRSICESEGITLSDNALRLVARAGEGSMRDSESLLDQVISFGGLACSDEQVVELLGLVDRSLLYQMLEGLVRGEPAKCLDAIAAVHDCGYDLSRYTSELLELLRNAALVALSAEPQRFLDVSDDELQRLASLVKGVPVEVFTRWFDALLEIHDSVARSSRPRLVLEMAVARLASTRPVVGIEQLIRRVEDLDRRLRTRGPSSTPLRSPGGSPPGNGRAGPAGNRFRASAGIGGKPGSPDVPSSSPQNPRSRSPSQQRQAAPPTAVGQGNAKAVSSQQGSSKTTTVSPGEASSSPGPMPGGPSTIAGSGDAGEQKVSSVGIERSQAEAFGRWLDHLENESANWGIITDHSAFGGLMGSRMTLVFPSSFHLALGEKQLSEPGLLASISLFFPRVSRLEARLRDPDAPDQETREEARKRRMAEYVRKVRQEAEANPLVRQLSQLLGARITGVVASRQNDGASI